MRRRALRVRRRASRWAYALVVSHHLRTMHPVAPDRAHFPAQQSMKSTRGRKAHTEPTPIQKRMIELAQENPSIKTLTLEEIGAKVALEFGRARPFSKQYIEQVFAKWSKVLGFVIYDKGRISRTSYANWERYLRGEYASSHTEQIIKRHNLPKRANLHTKNMEAEMERKSLEWKAGLPVRELAKLWKVTYASAFQTLIRYRKVRPDLFPRRRT